MPSKKSRKSAKRSRPASASRASHYGPSLLVSFRYLLGAAATAVAIGAAGAYLVLCLIFYQNQAMLIFHPSRKIAATPASVGLAYQEVTFAPARHGPPQLTGWWIPAAKGAPFSDDMILYLHGASGSLSETVPQLKALHGIGINVFALDYRGFGKSAKLRPTEQSASQDALTAWTYLTENRHLPPASLIVVGQGAGASFATHLATQRSLAGLVLLQISPTAHTIFERDARARLLPLFLLANQRMNPAPELKRIKTPKLFLAWPDKSDAREGITRRDYADAAAPRQMTSLTSGAPADVARAMQPFLSQVLSPAH